jgi:hypothetical protein
MRQDRDKHRSHEAGHGAPSCAGLTGEADRHRAAWGCACEEPHRARDRRDMARGSGLWRGDGASDTGNPERGSGGPAGDTTNDLARLPRRLIAVKATGERAICSPMDDVVALLVIAFGAVTALFAAGWVLVVERRLRMVAIGLPGESDRPGPDQRLRGCVCRWRKPSARTLDFSLHRFHSLCVFS